MHVNDDTAATVRGAARLIADAGLVDAFGHVSLRGDESFTITPPVPLAALGEAPLVSVPLHADALPDGAPKEAWIHAAIYRARPEVGAIVRAQPSAVAALDAADLAVVAATGHGALIGAIARSTSSLLVRSLAAGDDIARELGDADVIVLRGNGAVTTGTSMDDAVARMVLLERQSAIQAPSLFAGAARLLPADEVSAWRALATELLPRVTAALRARSGGDPSPTKEGTP